LSVAVRGDLLVVGGIESDNPASDQTFVYARGADHVWTLATQLSGPNAFGVSTPAFGSAVAISPDQQTIAVAELTGDVYVYAPFLNPFNPSLPTWKLSREVSPGSAFFSGANELRENSSLALSNSTLAVGRRFDDLENPDDTRQTNEGGDVVVYSTTGATAFTAPSLVVSPSPGDFADFGRTVGLSGDLLVVSEWPAFAGARAHVYVPANGAWTLVHTFVAGGFATSTIARTAVGGGTILLGAPGLNVQDVTLPDGSVLPGTAVGQVTAYGGVSLQNGKLVANLGTIPAGETRTLTVVESIGTADFGPFQHVFNETSVATVVGGVIDPNASNNASSIVTSTTAQRPGACTDSTGPVITPSVTGTRGPGGWYTSDVQVAWSAQDGESSISAFACPTQTISSDTNGTTLTCTATSNGGTTTSSVTIKRDATPPTISATPTPAADGTYTVTFACADDGSGVSDCPTPVNAQPGRALSVTVHDAAGLSGQVSVDLPRASVVSTQIVPMGDTCTADVHLDASASIDPLGGPLNYRWNYGSGSASGPTPTIQLPAGTYPIWLTVTNASGVSNKALTTVTVLNPNPPVFTTVPPAVIVPATGVLTQVPLGTPVVTDSCPVTVTSSAPAAGFPEGRTDVVFTATDSAGQVTTASTTVTIAPQVDLSITASTTPALAVAGENLTYHVTVHNDGPSTATGVVVHPQIPAGLTLVPVDTGQPTCTLNADGTTTCQPVSLAAEAVPGGCTLNGEELTCAADSLPAGLQTCTPAPGSTTCTPPVQYSPTGACLIDDAGVLACAPGQVHAGGTVSFDLTLAAGATARGDQTVTASVVTTASVGGVAQEPASRLANNSTSTTFSIAPQADLALTISAPASAVAGLPTTATLSIVDLGPSDASGFTVSVPVPAGATFVSGPGCTADTTTITCLEPALAKGQTAAIPIALAVGPDTRAPLTLAALATGLDQDGLAANNSASATVPVSAQADLSITVGGLAQMVAGSGEALTVLAANAGPSTASGVHVRIVVPSTISPQGTAGCTISPIAGGATQLDCAIGTGALAPNVPATFTIPVTADAFGRGPITYSGQILAGPEVDPNPANNTSMAATTIAAKADISVTLAAPSGPVTAGTPVTYTATITNAGPSGSTGTTLRLPLPSGSTFTATPGCTPEDGAVSCATEPIAPGGHVTISLPLQIDPFARDTIAQSASIASTAADEIDLNTANNSSSIATPVVASADLFVVADTLPNPATAGGVLTYAVTITNAGPSGVMAPMLTQVLPAGVHIQAAPTGCTTTGDVASGETLTCSLAQLAPHASTPLTILTQTDGVLRGAVESTLKVSATEADPDQTNNTSLASTPLVTSADLTIALTATPSSAMTGSLLHYHVHVTNAGPSSATGVTMTDHLPAGVGLASALLPAGCAQQSGTLTCTIAALASGAETDLDLAVLPTAAGLLTNTVTVTANETDPNPADNTATISIGVTGQSTGLVGTADFNGDGALDVAVGDRDSDSVHIWLNDGEGNFADAQTVPLDLHRDHDGHHGDGHGDGRADHEDAGDHDHHRHHGNRGLPPGLAAGDFNGDGAIDLAVANGRTDQVDILTNDGAGRFAMTAAVDLRGDDPVAIAAGDFNGDGALDLAIANRGTTDVSLFLNDTHGAFVGSAVVSIAGMPDPRVVDTDTSEEHGHGKGHDGKGHDDVGDHDDHGHEHDHPARTIACAQPSGLASGDFNGDGQLDLAVTCEGSDAVALLTNAGPMAFTLSAAPLSKGSGPAAVTAADLDGDGHLDLAVADRRAHRVSVLLNRGDANGQPVFVATDTTARPGNSPLAVAAGDLDGDGADDLATANHGANSVSVLLNDGAGGFPSALTVDVPACQQPIAITLGDFTGDGTLDLVVIDRPKLAPLLLTTSPEPPHDHGHDGGHHGPDHDHGPGHDHHGNR
jgi:uncharacterized repeat protein (TIGR01451 family)